MTAAPAIPPGTARELDAMRSAAERDGRPCCPVAARAYRADVDEGFVMASWARQIRKLPPCRRMSASEFRAVHERIGRLVEQCPPVVVCEPDHPTQLLAFICGAGEWGQQPVLHQIYVKSTWRQHGIGRWLMDLTFPGLVGRAPIAYTHPGRATPHLQDRWRLVYRPDLLEGV